MSVSAAPFEAELDAVDVARRAGQLIWDARLRVWPYVVGLAAVTAGVRWVAWQYGLAGGEDGYRIHDGETLAEFARHGAWLAGRALVTGLALAMTLRALLGVAQPWRPDRGLFVATAIYVGAAIVPLGLFLPTVLVFQANSLAVIPLGVATALGGAFALMAYAWFALRLVIWPVGAAAGDPAMTAGRAWQAMVGARLAWLLAGVLLVLPLLFGAGFAQAIVANVTGVRAWGPSVWEAPLHALAVLLWLAVSAVVYRRRAGLDA